MSYFMLSQAADSISSTKVFTFSYDTVTLPTSNPPFIVLYTPNGRSYTLCIRFTSGNQTLSQHRGKFHHIIGSCVQFYGQSTGKHISRRPHIFNYWNFTNLHFNDKQCTLFMLELHTMNTNTPTHALCPSEDIHRHIVQDQDGRCMMNNLVFINDRILLVVVILSFLYISNR